MPGLATRKKGWPGGRVRPRPVDDGVLRDALHTDQPYPVRRWKLDSTSHQGCHRVSRWNDRFVSTISGLSMSAILQDMRNEAKRAHRRSLQTRPGEQRRRRRRLPQRSQPQYWPCCLCRSRPPSRERKSCPPRLDIGHHDHRR